MRVDPRFCRHRASERRQAEPLRKWCWRPSGPRSPTKSGYLPPSTQAAPTSPPHRHCERAPHRYPPRYDADCRDRLPAPLTLLSEGMGLRIRFHISPPSGLHESPPPTADTKREILRHIVPPLRDDALSATTMPYDRTNQSRWPLSPVTFQSSRLMTSTPACQRNVTVLCL